MTDVEHPPHTGRVLLSHYVAIVEHPPLAGRVLLSHCVPGAEHCPLTGRVHLSHSLDCIASPAVKGCLAFASCCCTLARLAAAAEPALLLGESSRHLGTWSASQAPTRGMRLTSLPRKYRPSLCHATTEATVPDITKDTASFFAKAAKLLVSPTESLKCSVLAEPACSAEPGELKFPGLTENEGNWKVARVAFYLSNCVLPGSLFFPSICLYVQ